MLPPFEREFRLPEMNQSARGAVKAQVTLEPP